MVWNPIQKKSERTGIQYEDLLLSQIIIENLSKILQKS